MSLQSACHTPAQGSFGSGAYAPRGRVSVAHKSIGAFRWVRNLCLGTLLPPRSRRLRVSETVTLGDKRFVSIVSVDGGDYLIGGGAATVSLLTQLGPALAEPTFQDTVAEAWERTETA